VAEHGAVGGYGGGHEVSVGVAAGAFGAVAAKAGVISPAIAPPAITPPIKPTTFLLLYCFITFL
jgi:hypothetical protein